MNQTLVPSIDPEEEIGFMNIDETDFSSMNRAEQIRHFEVEGYVVFPAILNPDEIARLKSELTDAEMILARGVISARGLGKLFAKIEEDHTMPP